MVTRAYKAIVTKALKVKVGVEPLDLYLKTIITQAIARSILLETREEI